MTYKFATENRNHQDLASGNVLYYRPGTTAFPVRLASELFQRCQHYLAREKSGPYTLYDPCCGGAYLLTALGFLHSRDIKRIYASDIDHNVIPLAEKNLSMLTSSGLEQRMQQLHQQLNEHGKESARLALESAVRLQTKIAEIPSYCFQTDITIQSPELPHHADIVLTDLPYGQLTQWEQQQGKQPIEYMFKNLRPVFSSKGIIAVVSPKKTPISPEGYNRLKRFSIGKRQILIFQALT